MTLEELLFSWLLADDWLGGVVVEDVEDVNE